MCGRRQNVRLCPYPRLRGYVPQCSGHCPIGLSILKWLVFLLPFLLLVRGRRGSHGQPVHGEEGRHALGDREGGVRRCQQVPGDLRGQQADAEGPEQDLPRAGPAHPAEAVGRLRDGARSRAGTTRMKDFRGKLAVITGGGTGMGRALAEQLAAEGCHVAICDVSAENMAETKRSARRGAAAVARHHAPVRRLGRAPGARLPRRGDGAARHRPHQSALQQRRHRRRRQLPRRRPRRVGQDLRRLLGRASTTARAPSCRCWSRATRATSSTPAA